MDRLVSVYPRWLKIVVFPSFHTFFVYYTPYNTQKKGFRPGKTSSFYLNDALVEQV